MGKTLIGGNQLKLEDFIQSISSVNWERDDITASAKAIYSKINSLISEVSGAMIYKGEWDDIDEQDIRKGYMYVYNDDNDGTIGEGDNAVVLEKGDVLIARCDNADSTNAEHWTVVEKNLYGDFPKITFRQWDEDNGE